MTSKAEKFWDKKAMRFDSSEKRFEVAYKNIIAKTKKYLDSDDNVLDFGCATGSKTLELSGGIKHIHGLDISAEMITIALRKKDEAKAANVSFSKGSIFEDELEKSSFDKIIAYSIIHLLENSDKV